MRNRIRERLQVAIGILKFLRALEDAAAGTPPLRDIAAQLHVLGYR